MTDRGSVPAALTSGDSGVHLVAYTESPGFGGADISLALLLEALDPAIRVTVLGVEPAVVERVAAMRKDAASELVPPMKGKWDASGFAARLRALRRLRPDVFQANLHTPVASRYAVLAALLTPAVRVVVVEQLASQNPPTRGQKLLKRLAARRTAAHVAVGERAARSIEAMFGLRPGSIRVIHNAVPDRELQQRPRLREGRIVGSVGRLDRQKGHDLLVRSLAQLPADVSAVVVGDGPERDVLRALAAKLGVDGRFVVTGWKEDARDYLTSFDVFALPSRFEGFPLALLEAMLAGLPSVATDVGSVAEAIVDGETGLLIKSEDVDALTGALGDLLKDEQRAKRLGEAARAHVLANFSADVPARAFEALYDEILDR
jgi:glycosyltransferase involved in cell wall biosynthesis